MTSENNEVTEQTELLAAESEEPKGNPLPLIVGGAFVLLGFGGLYFWWRADYFHHEGEYEEGWAGYKLSEFVALCMFTFLLPLGSCILYSGIKNVTPSENKKKFWTFFVLSLVVFAIGCCGIIWGQESLKCLVVFCLDKEKYVEISRERPEAGLGFLSVIGMSGLFLCTSVGMTLFLVALCTRTKSECGLRISASAWAFVALIIILVFGFITFYVPNSWEYFVAARIANNAQLVASTDYDICQKWTEYTCPELPWALFKTKNIFVSKNLVAKVYPSNLIFFSYLLIVILLGLLLTTSKRSRLWSATSGILGFTRGELFFSLLTCLATGGFFFYWAHDHNYNGMWDGSESANIKNSERWSRSFGQLAVILLSFLLFPASKSSFLYSLFGVSWESTLWIHKILGYGMLIATAAHMILFYVYYYEIGNFPHDIIGIPLRTPIAISNFTVPLITLATWFMFIAVGIFGFWKIRRRFYAIFHFLHVASFALILPCILWHAAASWEYILPGFTVWFADLLLGVYRGAVETKVTSVGMIGNVVKISFNRSFSSGGGEYIFVNIPEISVIQWHPFSVCTSLSGDFILVKPMGDGTWTGSLAKKVTTGDLNFRVFTDGPYGGQNRLSDYERILFVAGGIGITPCISIIRNFLEKENCPHIALIWTCRDIELCYEVEKIFSDAYWASNSRENFSYKIFYTSSNEGNRVDESVFTNGRPNVLDEADQFTGENDRSKTAFFVCGPDGLVEAVKDASQKLGTRFQAEIFEL